MGGISSKSQNRCWKCPKGVVKINPVRYIEVMQKQFSSWGPRVSGVVYSSSRHGAPFLPGVLLVCLALVVLVAPKLVFGAVALVLLTVGLLLCYVAYRVIQFKRQLSELVKGLEKRFTVQGFPIERPDIDITEIDSKKIVFH